MQVDLTANDEGELLPTEKLCLRLSSFLAPADAFNAFAGPLCSSAAAAAGSLPTKRQCAWVHITTRYNVHIVLGCT